MPPINPPLKNDGPACRVCGCTEHNACLLDDAGHVDLAMTCSWVRTTGHDAGPLCTACAGTADDLAEAMTRARKEFRAKQVSPGIFTIGTTAGALEIMQAINNAAHARYRARKRALASAG